jgi:hypothetical protein
MAKKKILQDSSGQIWPVTVADCVYLTDGSKNLKKYIDDGLAGKEPVHSHPYLPTAGGTMTGNITLNNNLGLATKTAKAITDTSGNSIAAGTSIKIFEYNGSDNLHIGRDIYEKKLTSGATYLSGGSGMTIRTNTGSISLSSAGTTVMSLSGSQVDVSKLIYAKAGIKSGGDIVSDTALTDSLGTSTVPWNLMYAKGLGLRSDSTGTTVGSVEVETVGTTSAIGSTRLILGNNTASGTNTNAKGYIKMYGTNSGYTDIVVGNNTTSNATLTLPSSTGTLISSSQATFTTMPKFNMNDRNGTIFEIFGGDTNGHGVRFGGGGCTFIGSGESAANIITAESTSATDEQLYVTSDNNIQFYTKCGTIADRRKVTLNGSLYFYPDKAVTGSIGHADYPWAQMFSDTYHIYGSAGKTYGHLNVQTVGTTSTVGEARLVLGNSTAEGTADNSWGRICLYTKGSAYTYIQPGDNTIGITLTLPTAGGTLATTANINSKVANYLPLAGGNMTGNVNLANAKCLQGALATTATKTDGTTLAAGTYIDMVKMSSGDNLHLGAGIQDNNLKTIATYVTGGGSLILRTVEGSVDIKPNNTSILSVSSSEITGAKNIYAKAGVKTGGNIVSDTALTDNLGTDAIPFNYAKARYFQVFGEASKQYGNLRADTLGTTSTVGQTILTLGNSTASGTAGNAQGEINLYSSGTSYAKLKNRAALSSSVTIELPSASGELPIMLTDDAGYWGILPPTGSETTWLRTPKSGLLPYSKNIADSSSLGSASWPWNNVHSKNFKINGVDQSEYGYLKVITEGTADTTGEGRVMVGNNKATGTAGNGYGRIQMYGTNTGYTMITPGNNSTSNITLTLPSSSGTLARTADLEKYLPLTGGTISGDITYSRSSGNTYFRAKRTDTETEVSFGIGSGGTNHGVFSQKLNKWLVYGDDTSVYLQGNADTATKLATARTLTIGSTGKSFDGSGNVSWTLAEIMHGQGLTYDTPSRTLYVNNGAANHVTRIAGYGGGYGDYAQIGLCDTSGGNLINYVNVYTDNITMNKHLYINSGGIDLSGGGNITVNANKTTSYHCLDVFRKCTNTMSGYEFSSARFGCTDNYGGCASIETKHNGTTKGYLRVLPNNGIQLGSGKKLHIQNDAPTENVATGDIWIDSN